MVSIIGLSPTLPFIFPIFLAITSGLNTFWTNRIQRPGTDFVAGCFDKNYTITWTGPKGPLNDSTKPRVEVNAYGTILVFSKAVTKQSGNYTCRTINDSKLVDILIAEPMEFVDTPINRTVKEFETVILRCDVRGGINPTISWYTGGKEPKASTFAIIADGLSIENVTKEDAGVYTCKATESLSGEIRDRDITLKVLHKPYAPNGSVWVDSESAWGFIGSVVNLTCEAFSVPPPKFTWTQPINVRGKVFNDTERSILQVNITNRKAFGNYSCKVENSIGKIRKNFTLEPGEQPPPPDSVIQRGENSNLVDIGISGPDKPIGLMAPTGYVVQYRLLDDKENWKEKHFRINKENTYTLNELQHKSKYEVRVATKNIAGQSEFTNTSSKFFTLENITDGAEICNTNFVQHIFLILSTALLLNW